MCVCQCVCVSVSVWSPNTFPPHFPPRTFLCLFHVSCVYHSDPCIPSAHPVCVHTPSSEGQHVQSWRALSVTPHTSSLTGMMSYIRTINGNIKSDWLLRWTSCILMFCKKNILSPNTWAGERQCHFSQSFLSLLISRPLHRCILKLLFRKLSLHNWCRERDLKYLRSQYVFARVFVSVFGICLRVCVTGV